MLVGLGECVPDEAGVWVDLNTGEPCTPASSDSSSGKKPGIVDEISRVIQDIFRQSKKDKSPVPVDMGVKKPQPVLVQPPGRSVTPPGTSPATGRDLIPGVPNWALLAGGAFLGIVMLAVIFQRR